MYFGGVHFLAGVLFLACCIALTIFYVYGAYVIHVACRNLYASIKRLFYDFRNYLGGISGVLNASEEGCYNPNSVNPSRSFVVLVYAFLGGRGERKTFEKTAPVSYLNTNFLKQSTLLVIALLSIVYGLQRVKWMGNESTHYRAKEYYVAGQVVFAHRKVMALALHPENILIRPYTALQKALYSYGVRYLPDDDGERFVWKNQWFLYLYSRKLERPKSVADFEYEPEMCELLDDCWSALEGMANYEIIDPEMETAYLLGFPLLASYYSSYQGHYTGKFMCSGRILRCMGLYIDRNHRLLQWLDQLGRLWETTEVREDIKTRYPNVAAIRQGTILDLLQDLSLTAVFKNEFTCDHPLIARLHHEYIRAMSDDPSTNYFLLYSKKNRRQAKILYLSSVYGARGSAANYLLSNVCGKEMPEERFNISSPRDGLLTKFYEAGRVEFVFRKELKPLMKEKESG